VLVMHIPAVTVLVVDDHPALRAGLKQLLDQEPGYRLLGAVSSEAELALALRRDRPDVVVLDYALTRGDGLSACFRLKQGA
jgi:DNA-binding NarL/FixJ family response regulator